MLAEGESVFVPLRTAHRFWNSNTEPVVFEVEVRPARNFEKSLRAQFGLVKDVCLYSASGGLAGSE